MHHCVHRCIKSEVITLTSFVTDARTDGPRAFLCPPPYGVAMAGVNNDKIRYCLCIMNKMYYAASSDPTMTLMVTLRGYNDIESLK